MMRRGFILALLAIGAGAFPSQAPAQRCAVDMPHLTGQWLVGHDDHGHVRSLHNGDSVIATGRVDDVIPFVTRPAVTVVPLRWEGGTRIKILESLALGTPVVSTTIGAEGLDLVPGRDIVIADTAHSFADSVALLQDRSRQEALAAAGRRIVSDYYTWDRIIHDLRQKVADWLENRCSRPCGPSPPVNP